MGLNIGVTVTSREKLDVPPAMRKNTNIEEQFTNFIHDKFPEGGFGLSFDELPTEDRPYGDTIYTYELDARMFGYCGEFMENGYEEHDMYMAMIEFVFLHTFIPESDITISPYWSG